MSENEKAARRLDGAQNGGGRERVSTIMDYLQYTPKSSKKRASTLAIGRMMIDLSLYLVDYHLEQAAYHHREAEYHAKQVEVHHRIRRSLEPLIYPKVTVNRGRQ